jgi:oxygen-independent coproporphyrinogen III oxidase
MNTKLLEQYGGAVPRYTSYPTAPHFNEGVTAADYRRWLGEIPEDGALSLYFHVPFCARMCWYCGCHTKIVNRYDPISDYASVLALEADLLADAIRPSQPVSHIHWGGGTPTILSSTDLGGLMDRVRERFSLNEDAEIAIEIDPRTLDEDKAKALVDAGINRASLGIQDFNPDIQQAINRVQSFEQTKAVVDWLREAGIQSISFDLMYGLPNQSTDDVKRTVDLSHELKPDRLSIFGYAHVPWMKSHQKMIEEDALPDGPERMRQAMATAEQLEEHGYRRIGLDHFASPEDSMTKALDDGSLQRNFQGYTTDTASTLLGLGSSAIGNLAQGYVQNTPSMRRYATAVKAGEFPIAKGFELDAEDVLRRTIIERLMCDLHVDLSEFSEQSAAAHLGFDEEKAALSAMQDDGIVELDNGHIQVTETGRPFVRSVCAVFDTYLASGRGRHSVAV